MTKSTILTTSEAARILERSVDFVRKQANTGRLPALVSERGYRMFYRADVERLAAERKAPAA